MKSFVAEVLKYNGNLKPLILDSALTNGTGLFNPSVFIDNDQILVNIRHCQYTLYHSEQNIFEHRYGPLVYVNPENDISLTTANYIAELSDSLDITNSYKVNTSTFDVEPKWEFVGLEDARLIKWDNNLYLSGVRRDTTTNGEGRMELSCIEKQDNTFKEISRQRIPAPGINQSYCEKNWMPIVDKPYHYLKWCNPVEIVKYDPTIGSCETVFLGTQRFFNYDQRGGGQVIPWQNGYLTLTHETYLYKSEVGNKNATYKHRFIHWSKDWIPLKTSDTFSFMDAKIEFACGLTQHKSSLLITFGFQDNAAFILSVPITVMETFLNDYI